MKLRVTRLAVCLLTLITIALPVLGQGQFTYTTADGQVTITQYTGPGGEVIIPDLIDGLPVISIGERAFYANRTITGVTIPSGVSRIGNEAFTACEGLTNVVIPHSVTIIGARAFEFCFRLASFALPDNGVNLGTRAFAHTGPSSVTIPSSVTGVRAGVFSGAGQLTNITVGPGSPLLESVDGVLFNRGRTELLQYPAGRSATHYAIPEGVANIGDGAFAFSRSLVGVTIPHGVTNIGNAAFSRCTALASIHIPGSVAVIGDEAFADTGDRFTGLTNVVIAHGVRRIGAGAFARAFKLATLTIPASVTSLGSDLCLFCHGLNTVYFQGNAPAHGSDPFGSPSDGRRLPVIYYLPGTTGWMFNYAGRRIEPWTLPYPVILGNGTLGMRDTRLGFRISWTTGHPAVIESSASLGADSWQPISTNSLAGGFGDFEDQQTSNQPSRFYRLRPQ